MIGLSYPIAINFHMQFMEPEFPTSSSRLYLNNKLTSAMSGEAAIFSLHALPNLPFPLSLYPLTLP
jgi:hypothetical protein